MPAEVAALQSNRYGCLCSSGADPEPFRHGLAGDALLERELADLTKREHHCSIGPGISVDLAR